jgi:hypothetical protein
VAVRRFEDYRIKGVGHRHNAGQKRDLFSHEAVRPLGPAFPPRIA